jgi:fermentation-respiration switch protein FrsA (DUF1100 family)
MASSRTTGCAITILLVVLVPLVLLRLVSRSLIYPGSRVAFPPDLGRSHPGAVLLRYHSADGTPLAGALLRAHAAGAPTAVYFHGNAESAAQNLDFAATLVRSGISVFLPELRGYGGLAGRPTEKHLYADGEAALNALRSTSLPPEGTVLVGRSLGSGIAVELALRHPCAKVVLISPYTSMVDMGRFAVGPLAPLLVPDRYDNLAKIGRLKVPVVILHGTRDDVIPVRMGRALAAAGTAVRYIEVPEASHNDFPGLEARVAREVVRQELPLS